jgi:hypothetical protein
MSLFESAPPRSTVADSEFNGAVNASRFVKGFGIAAAVYSALSLVGVGLLSSAVGVGTGLFIFRYDTGRFYKVLGAAVIALALVSPLPFLSPFVLAASLLWKGSETLAILGRSPEADPDWAPTRSRVVTGMAASTLAVLVCVVGLVLFALFVVARLTPDE